MSRFRAFLKDTAPPFMRRAVASLRSMLNGPGIEYDVLRPSRFVADPDLRPRLSLILPSLSAREAFGGINTGLDVAFALANETGFPLRIVTEHPVDPTDNVLDARPRAQVELHTLSKDDPVLSTRRNEVFLTYNWWIALNLEPVLHAQAAHFGTVVKPKIPLIQEYEPHFYPFSAAHLLALEAFNGDLPIWGVFNSTELYDFYVAQGNRQDRAYVFEPRLNKALLAFLSDAPPEPKQRLVLVYGRPNISRNAFFLVHRGLEIWAKRYGSTHSDWQFLSAGAAHAAVDLGHGFRLASLGKLSLKDYGRTLQKTAIGLSLMSSPHPSYPPLEMAHFGARVITNTYANKRLEKRHDNIVSMPANRPEALATLLQREIEIFEQAQGAAAQGRSHMPDYLSDAQAESIGSLARDIQALIGG